MTEREISDWMHAQIAEAGLEGAAWDFTYCPGITAGPESPWGHVGPTDIGIAPGQLLQIDFGVKYRGYCADLQRTYYLLRPEEMAAPAECRRLFGVVDGSIQEAAAALRPGMQGREIDAVARENFAEHGLTWDFSFGHQVGRYCHDGGASFAPAWERYGRRPFDPIEVGQIYAMEIGARVPGYGVVSLEENIIVTEAGCEFISEPQRALRLVRLGGKHDHRRGAETQSTGEGRTGRGTEQEAQRHGGRGEEGIKQQDGIDQRRDEGGNMRESVVSAHVSSDDWRLTTADTAGRAAHADAARARPPCGLLEQELEAELLVAPAEDAREGALRRVLDRIAERAAEDRADDHANQATDRRPDEEGEQAYPRFRAVHAPPI